MSMEWRKLCPNVNGPFMFEARRDSYMALVLFVAKRDQWYACVWHRTEPFAPCFNPDPETDPGWDTATQAMHAAETFVAQQLGATP